MADEVKIVKFKHPKHGTVLHGTEEMKERVLNRNPRRNFEVEGSAPTDEPAGNAGKDDWRAYRLGQGHTEEALEGLGRDELRELGDPS